MAYETHTQTHTHVRSRRERRQRRAGCRTAVLALMIPMICIVSAVASGSHASAEARLAATLSRTAGSSGKLEGPNVVVVRDLASPAAGQAAGPVPAPMPRRAPQVGVRASSVVHEPPHANVIDQAANGIAGASEISTSFAGLNSQDNLTFSGEAVTPPDPQVAVGPDHIVEMVNIIARVYNKSGGGVQTFRLSDFFGVPAEYRDFDPKIVYDALSGRWFASYASFKDNGVGADEGLLHLAISQDSNPTDAWNVYHATYQDVLTDYPGLGLTNDKLTVSANLFDIDGPPGPVIAGCTPQSGYCGEQTIVIQKSDVMAGLPGPNVGAFFFAPRLDRFTVRPAHSLSSVNEQYLTTFAISSFTALTVIRITGTPNDGNLAEASATNVTMLANDYPPLSLTAGSADCVWFGNDFGIPPCVDSGDGRMLEAIWRDGHLWSSATSACEPGLDTIIRSCAHLLEVGTVGGPSLVQDIMYGAPGEYYSWPAIRTDAADNLYVSLTGTHRGSFASALVAGRLATDPPNTMSSACLLKAGEAVHDSGRWGDYQGAAVDPADPSTVWVVGEYAKDDAVRRWGTQIASLSFTTQGSCPARSAPPPKGALDFSIAVDTDNDGVDNCSTKAGTPTACAVAAGHAFTLKVYLNSLGGVPRYVGFDLYVHYTGVASKDNASNAAWPDCAFPLTSYSPTVVLWACIISAPYLVGSTYTGLIGTNGFNCTRAGSITMLHGANSYTDLVQWPENYAYAEAASGSETLTINCLAATATPTVTPTRTPHPPPLGGVADYPDVSGGSSGWPIALLVTALGAFALAAGALYVRRRADY